MPFEVMKRVYQFSNLIKKEGAQYYIYKELTDKNILDFDNSVKSDSLKFA